MIGIFTSGEASLGIDIYVDEPAKIIKINAPKKTLAWEIAKSIMFMIFYSGLICWPIDTYSWPDTIKFTWLGSPLTHIPSTVSLTVLIG